MSFDPNKIPRWLRRTPEQQAQDDALQEQLRTAQGPGARPNRTEAHLLRAAAVRLSAEAQLDHLTNLPDPNPQHVETALAQLAEAVAMQGDFAAAAEIHPESEHAARFHLIAEAIDRDDDDPTCNCAMDERHDERVNRRVHVPNETVTELVFSLKHGGKLMPLVQCVKCGQANVKPASPQFNQMIERIAQEHRNEAVRRRGR